MNLTQELIIISLCSFILGLILTEPLILFIRRFLARRRLRKEFKNYPDKLHNDILDHIEGFSVGKQFLRFKDKKGFATNFNERLMEGLGLSSPIPRDIFPYPECTSCSSFRMAPNTMPDCTGVKSWILCGYLLKDGRLKAETLGDITEKRRQELLKFLKRGQMFHASEKGKRLKEKSGGYSHFWKTISRKSRRKEKP